MHCFGYLFPSPQLSKSQLQSSSGSDFDFLLFAMTYAYIGPPLCPFHIAINSLYKYNLYTTTYARSTMIAGGVGGWGDCWRRAVGPKNGKEKTMAVKMDPCIANEVRSCRPMHIWRDSGLKTKNFY